MCIKLEIGTAEVGLDGRVIEHRGIGWAEKSVVGTSKTNSVRFCNLFEQARLVKAS